jgi:SpoVK/Ycf46/Vps4 family AAA+-type ATPase
MPDWIDDDTTGLNMVYDEFSFREMEFALKRLLDTTDKNIANLRDIVYEDKQFSFENEYNVQISTLNTIQNKAVNLCLNARDFAIVHGPPGTGKTMMARACAAQTKATFLKLAGPQLVQMFIGDGAKMVRDAFELAREKAPAIIFIDELDAVGTKRGSGENETREVHRTMLELLN